MFFHRIKQLLIILGIAFMEIDLISHNFLEILLVTTILAYISFSVYITNRDSEFFLSSAKQIKTQTDAFIYIDCLKQLVRKIENEVEDIILISLKTKHQISCKKTDCYCTKDKKNLKMFIQNYVKSQLQVLSQFFQRSISVLLSILYFKMSIFKFYPQILSKLQEYQDRFDLNIIQRFYIYCLKLSVKDFIKDKNLEIRAFESDKIFKLQQLNGQIKEILKQQIEIRQKKWKYLSLGFCQIHKIQNYCQKLIESIKRIKQIQSQNQNDFKTSKQFNLLLLFYMTKVSFLENGGKITENLKKIFESYKVNSFRSVKEFNKYIFHKKSCAIQTKIDSNINNMGIITAASSNIEEVFGISQEKAIGKSIQILMNQKLYNQHQQILMNWMKSGAWKTVGKLKEVYCIGKNSMCFSAIFYLKIYTKQTGLYFITSIFKINDNDFILLNSNGEIEGMGRKPLKILGQNAKGIPFRLMINSELGMLSHKNFEQNIVHHEIIMSLKDASQQVTEYKKSSINHKDFLRHQQLFYDSICNTDPTCYIFSFIAFRFSVGKTQFTALKILQSRQMRKMRTDCYVASINNLGSINSHDLRPELYLDQQTNISDDKIEMCKLLDNTSMSSLKSRDNLPVARIKDRFLDIIESPNKITDKKMKNHTKWLVFIAILLSLLNLSSYLIYKSLLIQIQQIYIADGSVSDIMQLTEIAYDHISNLKIQLISKDLQDFDSDLKSAKYLQNYVYDLRKISFTNLLKEKTSFHSYLQYMYIKDQAKWTLMKNQLSINIHQFFQHMYYLTQKLINQLQTMKNSNKTYFDPNNMNQFNQNYLQMLDANFPQMKRINEFELINYQQYSDISFDLLDKISILSMSLHFFLTLIGAVLINSYYRFRFNQCEECFKFFTLVPQIFIQKLKEYFGNLKNLIITQKKLNSKNRLEELLQIDTSLLFVQFKSKLSLNLRLRMISYRTYYKWIFILFLLIATNGLSFLITDNMRNFFGPSKKAIFYINQLMRKQNRKIETYFDLKTSYYLHPNTITEEYLNNLKIHLNSSLTTWNEVATNLTIVLSSYDPHFENNFKNALITDVCKLSSQFLPERQNQKCKKQLQYGILQKGIMTSMNQYQSIVQLALSQMKQIFVLKTVAQPNQTYFRQNEFVELDKMQIYMFKIYQLTQSVCYDSTQYIINDITNKFLYLNVGFIIFYAFLLLLWVLGFKKEKEKLSKLYGLLLLIPINILKSNSRIVTTLKQMVQYDQQ